MASTFSLYGINIVTWFLQLHDGGYLDDSNHGYPSQALNQQRSTLLRSPGRAFARLHQQVLRAGRE